MYEPKENEKTTPVVVYAENMLIYGRLVTKKIVRVNIILRTDSAPNYLHLLNAKLIRTDLKRERKSFDELYFPTSLVLGFHVAPQEEIILDYDPQEANRKMASIQAILQSFSIRGKIRISSQTETSTSLEVLRIAWLSIYDAVITTPHLPKIKIETPMLLVRPEKTAFGLNTPTEETHPRLEGTK